MGEVHLFTDTELSSVQLPLEAQGHMVSGKSDQGHNDGQEMFLFPTRNIAWGTGSEEEGTNLVYKDETSKEQNKWLV